MIKGEQINWDRIVFGVCAVMWVGYVFLIAFGDLSEWAR